MVFFSSRISPFTSTVILRDRSPRATAVVTSAMLRTCAVRLRAHRVDRVGEILPGAGDAGHHRLHAEPAFGADFARHARHFRGEGAQLLDHRVDGFLELQNLAAHVDGDLRDRSPLATAIVTSAMLRTWPVRFEAIELTLSVRSFQVPATPGTSAWPPSLPSVPTSRATRAHFGGERVELIDHRVDGVLQLAGSRPSRRP